MAESSRIVPHDAADIRDRDQIIVPAGSGRTAFVDVVDVADVASDDEQYGRVRVRAGTGRTRTNAPTVNPAGR